MSTPTLENTIHEILDLKRMREELDATIPANGGCVQPVGTGDASRTGQVRDGECKSQGEEDRMPTHYLGGYTGKLFESLRHLHRGQDKYVGAGAGMQAE